MRKYIYTVVVFLLFSGVAYADGAFKQVNTDRIQVEIPENWEAQNLNVMKTLSAMEGARSGVKNPLPNLVYQSRPVPSGASLRVRFVKVETATQDELNDYKNTKNTKLQAELSDLSNEMYDDMRKEFNKAGLQLLTNTPAYIDNIGNRIAIVFSYERNSLNGDANFKVKQYHVMFGKEKCIVTASYRVTQEFVWEPIMRKILNSLVISD